jgi:hypothetical protein
MLFRLQHRVYRRNRRQIDWARRQTFIAVSIIRRIGLQMHVQYPANGKITYRIHYRRVGLERHANLQTVQVSAGNARAFIYVLVLLGFYNGG